MPETLNTHIVQSYEDELRLLDARVVQMGGLAEQILGQAVDALETRDPGLAEKAIANDRNIDRLERELQEQAITMIAKRQPMAYDLRQIMMAIRIAGDLERVGDMAKNTAKRAIAVSGDQPPKSVMGGIHHMAEIAMKQLAEVLDAYAQRDAEKAIAVWKKDQQIDAMYDSLFRELLTYMMEDPRNIGFCTHLLFGAKNIERIGDHVTNIAETVHYLVTGETLPDDRPKSDTTSTVAIKKG
jgi:phosphate transport system protein